LDNGSVWPNRRQMSVLFGRVVKTIGEHINNALTEELAEMSSVAKFATVQTEGSGYDQRHLYAHSRRYSCVRLPSTMRCRNV